MEILILLLVGILLVVGIIGSIIPVIPGPPISYAAVLLMHFFTPYQFDSYLLMTLASIVVFVTFLDYWQQEIFGFALSSRPFKAKKIHVALCAIDVQTLLPFTSQWSPLSSTLSFNDAKSDPESGSE